MYWFLDSDGSVLYVGKAKNLKNRIAQYRQIAQLPPLKRELVARAKTVKHIVAESELSALLQEAEYIRLFRPEYNILLKDDRSPLYIVITKETWSRVLTSRRQDLVKGKIIGTVFGPYQSAYMARQVLKIIRPAFQWCSTPPNGKTPPKKPCFFYHLGMCSGACAGATTRELYAARIQRLKSFLKSDSRAVQKALKTEIETAARAQEFETAEALRQEYEAIDRLLQPTLHLHPDITTALGSAPVRARLLRILSKELKSRLLNIPPDWELNRIEGYDVSNLQGRYASVSMITFTDGIPDPNQYRLFNIRQKDTPDDYAMMAEALTRRQNHPEWGQPSLILIDGGRGQVNAVREVWKWETPVIGLAKHPDRLVFPQADGGFTFVPFSRLGEAGKILQHLRDEAHRFSKKQVHRRIEKRDIA